jgi:hypothetical protein
MISFFKTDSHFKGTGVQPSAAKHKTEFTAVTKDERRLFLVNVKTMGTSHNAIVYKMKILRRANCAGVELTGDQTHITGWRERVSLQMLFFKVQVRVGAGGGGGGNFLTWAKSFGDHSGRGT